MIGLDEPLEGVVPVLVDQMSCTFSSHEGARDTVLPVVALQRSGQMGDGAELKCAPVALISINAFCFNQARNDK
jgi:hypothetical protein